MRFCTRFWFENDLEFYENSVNCSGLTVIIILRRRSVILSIGKCFYLWLKVKSVDKETFGTHSENT